MSQATIPAAAAAPTFAQIACDGFYIYAVMSDGTLWCRQRMGFTGTAMWTQIEGPV